MKRLSARLAFFVLAIAACALLPYPALADFTFVQISDTHIEANPADPTFAARYEEAIRQINGLNPAFVIEAQPSNPETPGWFLSETTPMHRVGCSKGGPN
ncbi:MAG: hypothetical protein Q7T82_12325 [Armatimonadota bacterium]|nr:hypothetical protein [Armatimonadota bacterium]